MNYYVNFIIIKLNLFILFILFNLIYYIYYIYKEPSVFINLFGSSNAIEGLRLI